MKYRQQQSEEMSDSIEEREPSEWVRLQMCACPASTWHYHSLSKVCAGVLIYSLESLNFTFGESSRSTLLDRYDWIDWPVFPFWLNRAHTKKTSIGKQHTRFLQSVLLLVLATENIIAQTYTNQSMPKKCVCVEGEDMYFFFM